MTYNTKNTTVVFAFAALLLATPLAIGSAYAASFNEASTDNLCGFTPPTTITFSETLTKGDTIVAEETVVFDKNVDANASARLQITATDWIGDGDRSSGTMTIVQVDEDETVDIGGITYTAKDGPTLATEFQSTTGFSAIESAQSLADKVRSNDSTIRISTSGTTTLTIQAETRGAGGDAKTLTETATDVTVSGAGTLADGGDNAIKHIEGEKTKFKITNTATPGDSSGDTYAQKISFFADGVGKEILGGTDPDNDLDISFEISVEDISAVGTISVAGLTTITTESVTIGSITYSGTSGGAGSNEFDTDGSDAVIAGLLRDQINGDDGSTFTATADGDVVTVTVDAGGVDGNSLTLTGDTNIVVTAFAGGEAFMINLPYDGALTQTLTILVACDGT